MKENKQSKDSQIFEKEASIISRTDTVLTDPHISKDVLFEEYEYLQKRYKQLVKSTRKITQLGDMYQKKLRDAHSALEKAHNKIINDLELGYKIIQNYGQSTTFHIIKYNDPDELVGLLNKYNLQTPTNIDKVL